MSDKRTVAWVVCARDPNLLITDEALERMAADMLRAGSVSLTAPDGRVVECPIRAVSVAGGRLEVTAEVPDNFVPDASRGATVGYSVSAEAIGSGEPAEGSDTPANSSPPSWRRGARRFKW